MVGGFIILFSVVNKLLYHLHITAALGKSVEMGLSFLSFPEMLSIPFISGLFEITLGSDLTSRVEAATLLQQAMITSFILAFSGFSVQAQVASILAQTDIRFQPFLLQESYMVFLPACLLSSFGNQYICALAAMGIHPMPFQLVFLRMGHG